ncbi:hypothetical protein FRC17_001638, partial [Serendipita sp. 399]
MISQEMEEVSSLEARIDGAQQLADSQVIILQESEEILEEAKKLKYLAHITFKRLQDTSLDLNALDEKSATWKRPSTPPPQAAYDNMMNEKQKLAESHSQGIQLFRDDFQRVSQQVYELEAEVEGRRSILAYINESIRSLVDRRKQLLLQINRKKDLIGPRRRLPAELWALVFQEYIEEAETAYANNQREGKVVFPTLKLSHVCRFWRETVHNQPVLWKYIALPRAVEVSRSQWDRVNYYRYHLGSTLPLAYVTPDSRGELGSRLRVSDLLARFAAFQVLELRVSRRNSEAEDLLASLRVPVEELRLVGTVKSGNPGTSCPLKVVALKNVMGLYCVHVQPSIRNSVPHDPTMAITLVDFTQSYIDVRSVILFLEALPTVTTVVISLLSPYNIDSDGLRSAFTLPNLSAIVVPLAVIDILFAREVHLPSLSSVSLVECEDLFGQSRLSRWKEFLMVRDRRHLITDLTISGLPVVDLGSSTDQLLLEELPSLSRLSLRGRAVIAGLRTLSEHKHLFGKLCEM